MQTNDFVKKIFALIVIAALFLVVIYVLKSIIISIIFGLLLAYFFHPVWKKIHKYIKSKNLTTILLIFIIFTLIVIPLWFVSPILIKQIFDTYTYLQNIDVAALLLRYFPSIFNADFLNTVSVHFDSIVGKIFSSVLNEFTNFLVNIPGFLLKFAIVLFTFYFAVRDADKLKTYILNLSPFSASTEKKFMEEFRNITDSVIYGQVFVGILQGIALGIGLFILGVPRSTVLTLIAILVSIIPILGSWLVWLPVSLFLLFSGEIISGTILILYGALFVSSIDNFLRPYILSKSSPYLSVPIALVGTIGGLYAFGIMGIVIGPLILAYASIIIEFYRQGKLDEFFKK